jgi:hypothetical protein
VDALNMHIKHTPPAFNYRMDVFYYVLYVVIKHRSLIKDKEYAPINTKKQPLKSIVNIKEYIKYLKNGEFMIFDNYKIGVKSKHYKINPVYEQGVIEIIIQQGNPLFDNIVKAQRRKRTHHDRMKPFEKILKDHVFSISFDGVSAIQWVNDHIEECKRHYHITAINNITDHRFRYFNRNNTNNRVDTNFTNLKKELRQFIKDDLINIDLKNSQIFFLAILLNKILHDKCILCVNYDDNLISEVFGFKHIKAIFKIRQNLKFDDLANLKAFVENATNGTMYESLMCKFPDMSREQVKQIMFALLFSQNSLGGWGFIPYEKEKESFKQVYPVVYSVVELLKEKKHNNLAVFLQKVESYVFIDCISSALIEMGIKPITVHDNIMIQRKDQDKAFEVIKNVFFENFGVVPAFHKHSIH